VAELVDALDSGSSVRKDVGVQVPSSAPFLVNIYICVPFQSTGRPFNMKLSSKTHVSYANGYRELGMHQDALEELEKS
jgi:hypothetical protein